MSENRLGRETSPYLLQHKDNPVHWWPWGPEALAEAKNSGKPILLSIGYAACHWCHVMAHESFEDEETAALMNALFVNIKVDREERPDIDAIYMGALHRMGEHGGWPLTMFLDSEGRPFWGGTYFPKAARYGRPAFADVLRAVSQAYHEKPEDIAKAAGQLTAALAPQEPAASTESGFAAGAHGESGNGANPDSDGLVSDALLSSLTQRMVRAVDPENGGIRGAPKFPQWSFFWLLWRGALRYGHEEGKKAVLTTLTRICQGGIYDHLGGGFSRYSVDERWLVPHFEKMLYDNALLLDLLTEAWRETHDPLFAARIEETVGWVLREMVAEGGGFAASLDADSEGEEGRFYVWSADEILNVLGAEDASFFNRVYGVAPGGNWEGHTILNRLGAPSLLSMEEEKRLAECRARLFERRARRVRPGWDDKVLADWNGLMIAALARAARVFGRTEWLAAAKRAFDFITEHMTEGARLKHAWRKGEARVAGLAADYAFMIRAALRLYEAALEEKALDWARKWTEALNQYHWHGAGGYASTASDAKDVIVRLKSAADESVPNANALMIANLQALALLSGESAYSGRAEALVRAFTGAITSSPLEHAALLASLLDLLAPQQVVVAGAPEAAKPLQEALYSLSLPGAWEFWVTPGQKLPGSPALADKMAPEGQAAAFVCLGPQCSAPITKGPELTELLVRQRQA